MSSDLIGPEAGPLVGKLGLATTQVLGSVSVSCNSAAGVRGSWGQVSASIASEMFAVYVAAGTNSTTSFDGIFVEVGVGGSGSEVVVATGIVAFASGSAWATGGAVLAVPPRIAASSRVAVRVASINANAGSPVAFNVTLLTAPLANIEGY